MEQTGEGVKLGKKIQKHFWYETLINVSGNVE